MKSGTFVHMSICSPSNFDEMIKVIPMRTSTL
jgi:hypothetical protein